MILWRLFCTVCTEFVCNRRFYCAWPIFIPSTTTVSYKIQKCNVVGMAEQISKKHRHQVIMSSKQAWVPLLVSNKSLMVAKATMAGTLVANGTQVCNISTT